jgi:hypothetical protein
MKLRNVGARLAGVLVLAGGLAGCVDATVEVDVLSEATARATMTQVMAPEFYSMVQQGQDAGQMEDDFCEEGELTENADGSATCVISREGTFAELELGEEGDEDAVSFSSAGPGLVRVAFPTGALTDEVTDGEELNAEAMAMLEGVFEGRNITLVVSGNEIVETNMTAASDNRSAEAVIPFVDLINGEAELPEELYAVVRVN